MQVQSAMRVVCVFLLGIAVSDGFSQMTGGNQRYPMMGTQAYHPYQMNNQYQMNSQYSNYNRGYSNNVQRRNGDSDNSAMNFLPFLMGGDKGKKLATYSMMMNPRSSNSYLPYYLMNNGMENAWPMMAFMNGGRGGGRGLDPYMMMTYMNFMN